MGAVHETTASGISTTVYGGGGSVVVPNNEGGPDVYEVTRMGVGALGIARPWANVANGTRETSGFFALLGGSFELDHSLHTVCGYECAFPSDVGERYWGKHIAARLGLGYSFPIFEFRVGALAAIPDPHVSYAMPMLIPDVMARVWVHETSVGSRSGWARTAPRRISDQGSTWVTRSVRSA
jgi:hypothetical protein